MKSRHFLQSNEIIEVIGGSFLSVKNDKVFIIFPKHGGMLLLTVQVGEHHGVLVPLVAHYVLVDFEKLFGTHLPSQFLTNRRVALSENRMTPC